MATQIDAKNHAFREPKRANLLTVGVNCPHYEAIIDENRLEEALRAALAVPDLVVTTVKWEAN